MERETTATPRPRDRHTRRVALALALWLALPIAIPAPGIPPAAAGPGAADSAADTTYATREPTSAGTGRWYMGREISQVMGHRGADWLERPAREREEDPDSLVAHLGLTPTDVVADIGAGTGYFTFRISPLVPRGRVLAVDIQQEMLDAIGERMAERGVDNVIPVLGTITDPHLPAGQVDVALLVDAYHEFSHPREMMSALYRALRPGGRVVLVEYRLEDPDVPIRRLHKMSQAQARREMAAVGLEWVETRDFLPRQHFMVFRKPAGEGTGGG